MALSYLPLIFRGEFNGVVFAKVICDFFRAKYFKTLGTTKILH